MAAHCGNLMLRLRLNVFSNALLRGSGQAVYVQQRFAKHWNPKWKKQRREKVIKVELPDFEQFRMKDRLTPEEARSKLKEKGVAPGRVWMERPIYTSCSGGLFDPYVPPEGDGKMSLLSQEGAMQRMRRLEKKGRSVMNVRKIRSYEDDFHLAEFAEQAQQIYIDVHRALAEKNKDKLHELVTENCYPELMQNVVNKTLRWQFIKSLEPPRAVHVRCEDLISKDNMFGQVTVRMHTQQTLAVYDRFGRLMHGSEVMAKDVLEYVVFEKHLSDLYGTWRVHSKIIPEWQPVKDPVFKTYVKPEPEPEPQERTKEHPTEQVADASQDPSGQAFATA
ncbi:conserved hypothetical protein [Ixodes scapularis]|uniref:Large ribosomal subunit protein mL45 n=1 Tax=Ixodes scapularis TaxID=6945 RepID=B7PKW6_IXOSC|nr:conserved hypothetical protein [Ixodes scapularis]|eukprot:XP_002434414.1 conserved hypothetical protein [Ixodes scapularis]